MNRSCSRARTHLPTDPTVCHHLCLPRAGRRVEYRDALSVGQYLQDSSGLTGSQLRTFGMMILNFLRAAGLRDEAFLHGQLRAGGVPYAATEDYGAPHPALPGREMLTVYGLEQCRMRRLRGKLAW